MGQAQPFRTGGAHMLKAKEEKLVKQVRLLKGGGEMSVGQ
jgi:hypothetical protein